jgi:hypothetical protein
VTTYYQFIKSRSQAPSFMPTLDGQEYTISITWNISAQRYYVNCSSLDGTLLFSVPLISSLSPMEIETLEWDEFNGRVIATTVAPLGLPIGQVINLTVIGAIPNTYNGTGFTSILSKNQFTYPIINNPGQAFIMGSVEYLINMAKGYFQSTLIYRNEMFEVSP